MARSCAKCSTLVNCYGKKISGQCDVWSLYHWHIHQQNHIMSYFFMTAIHQYWHSPVLLDFYKLFDKTKIYSMVYQLVTQINLGVFFFFFFCTITAAVCGLGTHYLCRQEPGAKLNNYTMHMSLWATFDSKKPYSQNLFSTFQQWGWSFTPFCRNKKCA